ncbi:hypothetical protein QFZ97_002574 [Paraburkholderia youngii]
MIKRRQFIGGLTALSASYLLAACGGGGSGTSDDKTAAAAAASGASGTAASKTAVAKTSDPNSVSIPPASSITDNSGNVWTLSGGVGGSVYCNGSPASNTYNVQMVLFYAGVIYHEGTGGQFYQWTGSGWKGCIDPRLGGTSADGTTIPGSSYIIDKSNNIWTVNNGVILCNGAPVGNTYNVSLLLWYGGKIWHCGTGGQFYVNNETAGRWLPCNDPRTPIAPAAGMFYGMNGHFDYTYTPQQVVSILKGMGCTSYRVGCTNSSNQLNALVGLAQAFQSAGMTLIVLINQGVYDSNGNVFANESAAYNQGYSVAQGIANALKPYGVTIYECGNELTRTNATVLDFTAAGTKASDFNNANWPAMRGVMRGMIDGVKSVQSNAKCGINFCVNDVGAADALWEGMQPDGSGGHPTVRWDITTWHNYEVYGDVFSLGADGAQPGFDLPIYCKARYGRAVPHHRVEHRTGTGRDLSWELHHDEARRVLSESQDAQYPGGHVLRARQRRRDVRHHESRHAVEPGVQCVPKFHRSASRQLSRGSRRKQTCASVRIAPEPLSQRIEARGRVSHATRTPSITSVKAPGDDREAERARNLVRETERWAFHGSMNVRAFSPQVHVNAQAGQADHARTGHPDSGACPGIAPLAPPPSEHLFSRFARGPSAILCTIARNRPSSGGCGPPGFRARRVISRLTRDSHRLNSWPLPTRLPTISRSCALQAASRPMCWQ